MPFYRLMPHHANWSSARPSAGQPWRRARSVPHTAIPAGRDRARAGAAISVLVHALVLFLVLWSVSQPHTVDEIKLLELGAGGPGPVGGGGGGMRGTGSIRYVTMAPPPKAVVAPKPDAVIPPPIPKPVEPVLPQLEMPKLAEQPKVEVTIKTPIIGVGGGTGSDGTAGNGPGTGGGIGSGIGTGNGSGVGPGTGGGNTLIHAPTLTELFIPPLPMPASVKGSKVIAEFDVDSTGRVLHYQFTHTRDRGYDKKLDEVLKGFRFRPGTTLEGVPVRAKAQITLSLGG